MRHGAYQNIETEPTMETPLSDTGVTTTNESVQQLENKDIKSIYSSQLARARQTADIAANKIKVKIEIDPNLNERIKGKEEFEELFDRAKSFTAILSKSAENLLVVTHSEILAVILGYMIFGEKFTNKIHTSTKHFLYLHESEIIAVEKRDRGWKISGVEDGI